MKPGVFCCSSDFPAGVQALLLCRWADGGVWLVCVQAHPSSLEELVRVMEQVEKKLSVALDAPVLIGLARRFLSPTEVQAVLDAPDFIHPDLLGTVSFASREQAWQGSWCQERTGEA